MGAAATIQLGAVNLDTATDITGLGLEFSAFAAAKSGVSVQVSGTGPWWGDGSGGFAAGYASGVGTGISGMITYTWLNGETDISTFVNDVIDFISPFFD